MSPQSLLYNQTTKLHANIFMHNTKSNVEVNKKMQHISVTVASLAQGEGGPGEMTHVYPKQADYSAYDSWSQRFRVNKESESASLLIPSAGRDKLSPLMKSFHRLHAGGQGRERACVCGLYIHLAIVDDNKSFCEKEQMLHYGNSFVFIHKFKELFWLYSIYINFSYFP